MSVLFWNSAMRPSDLLHPRPEGLYCPPGDFFIDPVRPVARALITHGHADHARAGHGSVLATRETLAIMAIRYGANFADSTQTAAIGSPVVVNGVSVCFHPAGHVLGSAQIMVELGGLRIVVSGDYKREPDPTCLPFEAVPCDVFVTEATFGLPIFKLPSASVEIDRLIRSTELFPERAHLLGAYALGKAQRLVRLLRLAGYDRPIYLHGAMEKLMAYFASEGIDLGELRPARAPDRARLKGEIVLCPPGQLQDLWARRFPDPVAAFASGWMQTRARARQRGVELPLVVSDHADWPALCATIRETGCREVWITHGQEDGLLHWASTVGLAARPLNLVGYGDDGEAEPEQGAATEGTDP